MNNIVYSKPSLLKSIPLAFLSLLSLMGIGLSINKETGIVILFVMFLCIWVFSPMFFVLHNKRGK